jgi:SNF2 family DNA or RNA helicase
MIKFAVVNDPRGNYLKPASRAVLSECVSFAEQIPGAHVNYETGEVRGMPHALQAVQLLAGDLDRMDRTFESFTGSAEDAGKLLPEYQRKGAGFMYSRLQRGALCMDDVGLGKTVQTIRALTLGTSQNDVKVVLCPAFLRNQWKSEIEKWTQTFNGTPSSVHVIYPKSDKRSKLPAPARLEWIVAYYLDASRVSDLIGYSSYFLVMDEIHNCRGFKTQRAAALETMAKFASGRIGLTASELYNKPVDLYPLLNFVNPGAWGSFYMFAMRYAGATKGEWGLEIPKEFDSAHLPELRERMSTMSFRRVKEDVADQLPFDTKYQTVWLEPPPDVLQSVGLARQGMTGLMKHLKHVSMFKVEHVVSTVQNEDQPCIVFTWLREQAERIAGAMPNSMLVLGGDDSATRLQRIGSYVAQERAARRHPVVVGTMDALGEGANLQFAKVVHIAALDYTPDKIRQAVGRAARMGQTGTVTVRIYACKNTIDEHYVKVLVGKLTEQFKLAGRKEKGKLDLKEALSPDNSLSVLEAMYKRLKEQQE